MGLSHGSLFGPQEVSFVITCLEHVMGLIYTRAWHMLVGQLEDAHFYLIPGSSLKSIKSAKTQVSGAKLGIHMSSVSHSNFVGESRESCVVGM